MVSFVMTIGFTFVSGGAVFYWWKATELQRQLDAVSDKLVMVSDEAAKTQRLFEMEMVKSCGLKRANQELTETVQRMTAQRQIVTMRVIPRTIYFN